MISLFHETFDTETNHLPGGWFVEFNSNLKDVPAIRCGEQCIELLSAGNKFLPVIPDISDCTVRFSYSFNYRVVQRSWTSEAGFGLLFYFRYDTFTGRGQALRVSRNNSESMKVEYGFVRRNIFTAEAEQIIAVHETVLENAFDGCIVIKGDTVRFDIFGGSVTFNVKAGKGKIAIAREHFFDVLKILAFDIETEETLDCSNVRKFTVPLSEEPTHEPLFCDVALQDFGNCMDVSLSLHGGVRESEIGEGTYHGLRYEHLIRPYLKVITRNASEQHTVYRDYIVLVPEGLAPAFFYETLHKKVDWPFQRKVRFLKPQEKFDLAYGFEHYSYRTNADLAQTPSETVFDLDGNVLYSGLGISGDKIKTEFLSQDDKEIISRLPEDEPRYEQAVQYAKDNHFFFAGETPHFSICVTGMEVNLPCQYEVVLEDVYFRRIKSLHYTIEYSERAIGVRRYSVKKLRIEDVNDLACGIYHLRVKSLDPDKQDFEEYCAFEIMSREKGALPPPLLSGLPYLYNSRTETRGLRTDGFDVWKGKSVNAAHYISCSNFLPPFARANKVIPTVHAYGREYFLWLHRRCCDKHLIKDNLDLIKDTDYLNVTEELVMNVLYWLYLYADFLLDQLIIFAEEKNDPGLNVDKLKQLRELQKDPQWMAKKYFLDQETFVYLADHYWEEWLDFINLKNYERRKEVLAELRKHSPGIRYAQYGPAPIYASCYKGPDFDRVVQKQYSTPDVDGFWQFEDYPYACRYELARGSYYLTSCLLAHPGARIYPEVYIDGGFNGCPDGAVFYAHPPFGHRPVSYPQRMSQLVFEYRFASAHFVDGVFKFWENCGFQACDFNKAWNESLLNAWRIVDEHRPVRPVYRAAFVSSDRSRRAADTQFIVKYPHYNIMDVRNTATESVPYIAQVFRMRGLPSGYQIMDDDILSLTRENTELLVLPPLNGMLPETLAHIRKLYAEGVALIGCEDVTGLEDLFGVENTAVRTNVTRLHGVNGFCEGMSEFCDNEGCTGRYRVTDAEVLVEAEIPVMTVKRNASGTAAAFINVAPNLVKDDQLQQRMSYGNESISDFMEAAVAELVRMIAPPPVSVSQSGRMIACHTEKGEIIVLVYNPSYNKKVTMYLEMDPAICEGKTVSGNIPFTCVAPGKYRFELAANGSGYLVFQ